MDYEALKKAQEEEGLVVFDHAGQPFSFKLREVAAALYHVNDVAHVNKYTAQVLADQLVDAEAKLAQIINRALSAAAAAEQETKRVWNRLLLDFVPGAIAARKLSDSQDNRKALVTVHEDYVEAQAKERHMDWVVNDLKSKKERVYHAFTITRAVMGERFSFHQGSSSHGAPQREQAAPSGKYGPSNF